MRHCIPTEKRPVSFICRSTELPVILTHFCCAIGLFITEALHPFELFRKAGLEVDLVSETGHFQPDWLSLQKDWLSDSERATWEDHSSEFRSKLDKLLKPGDIKPDEVPNLVWILCFPYLGRKR